MADNLIVRIEEWYLRRLRAWLRRNPRSLRLLRRFRCFGLDGESLARGLAVGLFFGLTPTVGFQTSLVLPSCLLLRANFPVAFAATWVSNPLTIGPLYFAFGWLGRRVFDASILSSSTAEAYPWLDVITEGTLQMSIGCLFIATPAAILGYWVSKSLGRKVVLHKSDPSPDKSRSEE